MSTFTIDADNVVAYATAEEAGQGDPAGLTRFDSEAALAKLSADWPLSRFVEIYNTIPGNTEVTRFSGRKKAVARVWKAIQPLAASASANDSAPEPEKPKRGRKHAKPAKKAGSNKASARPAAERSNKKAEVIAMMKRAKGATLAEIMPYASHCTSLA